MPEIWLSEELASEISLLKKSAICIVCLLMVSLDTDFPAFM